MTLLAPAMALSLWSALLPPWGNGAVQKDRISGWTAIRERDNFTGEVVCHIRRHNVSYRNGVVTLHLPRAVNTANALYRVDAGRPHRFAETRFEVLMRGAKLTHPDLYNPSLGQVSVPMEAVQGSASVMVQPSPGAPAWRFRTAGLSRVIPEARRRGCVDQPATFAAAPAAADAP